MLFRSGQAGEMMARLTFKNQNVIRVHLRIWCLERDYIQPKIGMAITGADNEDQVDPMAATHNQFYRNIAQNVAPVVYDYDIEQDRFFYSLWARPFACRALPRRTYSCSRWSCGSGVGGTEDEGRGRTPKTALFSTYQVPSLI